MCVLFLIRFVIDNWSIIDIIFIAVSEDCQNIMKSEWLIRWNNYSWNNHQKIASGSLKKTWMFFCYYHFPAIQHSCVISGAWGNHDKPFSIILICVDNFEKHLWNNGSVVRSAGSALQIREHQIKPTGEAKGASHSSKTSEKFRVRKRLENKFSVIKFRNFGNTSHGCPNGPNGCVRQLNFSKLETETFGWMEIKRPSV